MYISERNEKLTEYDVSSIKHAGIILKELDRIEGFLSVGHSHHTVFNGEYVLSALLSVGAFMDTFEEYVVKDFTRDSEQVYALRDEVLFYTFVDIPEHRKKPLPEKPKQLPSVIMTDQKAQVLKLVIDFYRANNKPDPVLEQVLEIIRDEIDLDK